MPGVLHDVRQIRTAPLPHLRQRHLLQLFIQHDKQGKVGVCQRRACDICAYHYSDKEREKFKTDTIRNLTNLCMQALANKMHMEDQMKKVEMEIPKEEDKVFEKRASEERGKRQNERL